MTYEDQKEFLPKLRLECYYGTSNHKREICKPTVSIAPVSRIPDVRAHETRLNETSVRVTDRSCCSDWRRV